MKYIVVKRDGSSVNFEVSKIRDAMEKAFIAVETPVDDSVLELLSLRVISEFAGKI